MIENIRDRGTKKWAMAMMLPEHVEALRKWIAEDHYVERPQLDEFDLQALHYEIEVAYRRQCEVDVNVWNAGSIRLYMGKICKLNTQLNYIAVDSPFGDDRIPVSDIVSVKIRE